MRKGSRIEIKSGQISKITKGGIVKKTGAIPGITRLQELSSPMAFRPVGYAVHFADKTTLSIPADIANLKA